VQTEAIPLNLVVVSVKQSAARCRVLETSEPITLRATGLWRVAPGEILTVQSRKRWTYAKNAYLSGEIIASRIDVSALGLPTELPVPIPARSPPQPDAFDFP
jgi:hypothetical protein